MLGLAAVEDKLCTTNVVAAPSTNMVDVTGREDAVGRTATEGCMSATVLTLESTEEGARELVATRSAGATDTESVAE